MRTMESNNNNNNNFSNNNNNNKGPQIENGKKNLISLGCCNINIIDYFSNKNLFLLCCIAACLSLIAYLAAFSCEVSWILEAKGNLPTISYLLCSGYFIMFVASTILIHGLATGLSWGLFSWSIIIGFLSIPELCFVMFMTTQYWGLQSTHGLTELIGYLIRLVINCLALLCVIPTALRWKRQQQLLTQLQGLASRLQLQTPSPTLPVVTTNNTTNNIIINNNNNNNINANNINKNEQISRNKQFISHSRNVASFDNPAFINTETQLEYIPPSAYPIIYGMYPTSPNEFNASIFGLDPSQYIGSNYPPINPNSKRTQSLLDLRYVIPNTHVITANNNNNKESNETDAVDSQEIIFNNNKSHQQMLIKSINNHNKGNDIEHITDPIYQTISSEKSLKSLGRNCISLENLEHITATKHDVNSYKNNLLQNYNALFMLQGYPIGYQQFPIQFINYHHPHYHNINRSTQYLPFSGYGGYTNPNPYNNRSNTNSKQSLGNDSDDYRKYRDVAL